MPLSMSQARKKWNRPDCKSTALAWKHRMQCVRFCEWPLVSLCDADGEGNEEAEDNMEEVDRNLDQMGTLLTGLNSMAVVSAPSTKLWLVAISHSVTDISF